MNGFRVRFVSWLLIVAFAATLVPSDLAHAYHRHKDVELTEDDYDPGYAYEASAYVPSIRPQVVLISAATARHLTRINFASSSLASAR